MSAVAFAAAIKKFTDQAEVVVARVARERRISELINLARKELMTFTLDEAGLIEALKALFQDEFPVQLIKRGGLPEFPYALSSTLGRYGGEGCYNVAVALLADGEIVIYYEEVPEGGNLR